MIYQRRSLLLLFSFRQEELIVRVPAYIPELESWLEQMKHGTRLDVAVRFAETDAYGHMNNRVPFVYFEDVRTLMLEETGYSLAETGISLPHGANQFSHSLSYAFHSYSVCCVAANALGACPALPLSTGA